MNRFRNTRLKWAAAAASIGLMMGVSSCGPSPQPDVRPAAEKAVRDADAAWSKAASERDLEGAVSFYTEDASMMPPNAPIATGDKAIRGVWEAMMTPGSSVSWQPSKVEVARSGELAVVSGSYQSTEKDASGGTFEDRGKTLVIWKKQADGKWKVAADMFSSDLPAMPSAAPPAKKTAATKATHTKTAHHKKHH